LYVTSIANYPESAGIQLFHLAHLDGLQSKGLRKRGAAFRFVSIKLRESSEEIAKLRKKLAKQTTYHSKRNI